MATMSLDDTEWDHCLRTSNLDQDRQIFSSAFLPGVERCKKLKFGAGRRNLHIDAFAALWRCLVERCAVFEVRREFFGMWRGERKRLAVLCRNRILRGVVLQRPCESKSRYQLR